MTCKKCGNTLGPGDKVCGRCGTPVSAAPNPAPSPVRSPAPVTRAPAKIALGGVNVLFAALAALHILQLILWFSSYLYAGAKVMGESIRSTTTVANLCKEEEVAFFTPVFVILFLAAAALAVLPILVPGKPHRRRMICSKIVAVLTFLVLILFRIDVNESNSFGLDVGFTFAGWLNILDVFAIIALTVYISHKTAVPKQ